MIDITSITPRRGIRLLAAASATLMVTALTLAPRANVALARSAISLRGGRSGRRRPNRSMLRRCPIATSSSFATAEFFRSPPMRSRSIHRGPRLHAQRLFGWTAAR